MAESSTFGKSINLSSDQIPETYCEPCHDISGDIKPVAGYCLNCDERLCKECYDSHLRRKQFRNHQLQLDKPTTPKPKTQSEHKLQDSAQKCSRHHGETLQLFCKTHSQVCCKVCLTINHPRCDTEDISKMARDIQTSGQLDDLNQKLSVLKSGFNDNLSKAETNRSTIQSSYTQSRDDMKKLREDFDRLMTETENQAEIVKEEDSRQSQSISKRCNVIIEQINKITANLEQLKNKGDNDNIFISMIIAENELQSLEENLSKLDTDNTVREYTFEPDMKLQDLLSQLKVLGNLSFLPATSTSTTSQAVSISTTSPAVSISQQMAKTPTHVKDIKVSDKILHYHGSVVLPNQQLLVTDYENKKVKLIDTNKGTELSQIQLSCKPVNITKVKTNELAVLLNNPNIILLLNLSQNIFSRGKELSVSSGECYGLAYNDIDQTFVVAFYRPATVELINMTGTIIRTIQTDSKGSALFSCPYCVAMNPDMSGIYVTGESNDSVILLSLNGDVKAVYKDKGLNAPNGICVHKSGVVYVAGYGSHTVHHLNPDSGEFKLLLDQKDGLSDPYNVSYCDVEDKIYIGLYHSPTLKVFEMK